MSFLWHHKLPTGFDSGYAMTEFCLFHKKIRYFVKKSQFPIVLNKWILQRKHFRQPISVRWTLKVDKKVVALKNYKNIFIRQQV